MTIVTHTSPDWDAIGAVWLLKRYGGMEAHDVVFVNTGVPDPAVLASAAAVVDTGREYDPARLRFDHHQFPGRQANDDSATLLVWADEVNTQGGAVWIEDIAMLIFAGDTGRPDYGAEWSRLVGIHALLSARKARKETDAALMEWGFSILDDLAAHLKAKYEARATLDQFTVYRSADGLVRGLQGAPQGATFAAFEDGARLVLFTSESEGTVSVGAMRGGEGLEPDCGVLVGRVLERAPHIPIFNAVIRAADLTDAERSAHLEAELSRWFKHPAGFFAGRGTAKAPDPTPLTALFSDICGALDFAWSR